MEEEFAFRSMECMRQIRDIIELEGSIKISEINDKANICGSKTTRILDMLSLYDYIIDYEKGTISK